jgi:hypothetical protein
MLNELGAVGAVVLALSLACAGADGSQPEGGHGEPAHEPSEGAGADPTAEGVPGAGEANVLGNEEAPEITEGSNTNWRPLEPAPGDTRPLPLPGSAPPATPPLTPAGTPPSTPTATSTPSPVAP